MNRNTRLRQKKQDICTKKTKKKEKLKIMHEKQTKSKSLSKSRKQWFFPRAIFPTRINDIF